MFPAFQHFELTVRDRALFSRREGGRSGKLGNSNLFFMFPDLKLLNNSSSHNLVNNVSSHYDFEHLSQNFKYSGNSIHRHSGPGVTPTSSVSITRCSFINNLSSYSFWSRFRYFSCSVHNHPSIFLRFCPPRHHNKQLLDEIFVVISRMIKAVSGSVISLSLRPRLITLTSTLIILDITKNLIQWLFINS